MEKVFFAFGAGLVIFVLIGISCITGAVFGALAGWITGFVFQATAAKLLAITGFQAYQLGAMAGFVGSFFHSSATTSKKD